jgi:hypothetical protein
LTVFCQTQFSNRLTPVVEADDSFVVLSMKRWRNPATHQVADVAA